MHVFMTRLPDTIINGAGIDDSTNPTALWNNDRQPHPELWAGLNLYQGL